MSEEKKVDVTDYTPVRLGWLKFLFVLVDCLGILVSALGILLSYEQRVQNRYLVLFLVCVSAMLVDLMSRKDNYFKFFPNYYRENVRSWSANFSLTPDGQSLRVSYDSGFERHSSDYGGNQVIWRFKLGGWSKSEPELFVYSVKRQPGDQYWHECWGWKMVLNQRKFNRFDDCARLEVSLTDRYGNRQVTTLLKALRYLQDPNQKTTDKNLSLGLAASALAELTESTLAQIENSKRFGNSEAGRAIKFFLDIRLSELMPTRERHYADVSTTLIVEE